jgi:large subunit ribosomal protein L35
LPIRATSAISRTFAARLNKGCRGGVCAGLRPTEQVAPFQRSNEHFQPCDAPFGRRQRGYQESQMPKLKTKSGAKKRFKITGTGKVVSAHAGKRHGMIKRTKKQIRQLRGTRILFKTDGDNVKQYFLPND